MEPRSYFAQTLGTTYVFVVSSTTFVRFTYCADGTHELYAEPIDERVMRSLESYEQYTRLS